MLTIQKNLDIQPIENTSDVELSAIYESLYDYLYNIYGNSSTEVTLYDLLKSLEPYWLDTTT